MMFSRFNRLPSSRPRVCGSLLSKIGGHCGSERKEIDEVFECEPAS